MPRSAGFAADLPEAWLGYAPARPTWFSQRLVQLILLAAAGATGILRHALEWHLTGSKGDRSADDRQVRAIHGRRDGGHQGWLDGADRRLRRRGSAEPADRRADRAGRQGPHRGTQQRRGRARWRGAADGPQARAQGDLLVPAQLRPGGVRDPLQGGRDRARIDSARHARRAYPRGRRGRARLLHRDRRRHPPRDGQGAA